MGTNHAVSFQTGHIGLNVSDLDRSKKFYEEVFGFTAVGESKEEGRRFAFLGQEDKLVLTLWQQAEGRFEKGHPGLHHLSFQVAAIQEVQKVSQKLKALNVRSFTTESYPIQKERNRVGCILRIRMASGWRSMLRQVQVTTRRQPRGHLPAVSFERLINERRKQMARVYHPGERSVQERAGVREMADRIGRSIGTTIPPTAWNFLRSQPLVVVGSVDAGRRVWASLLTGAPGLVQAVDENTVRINAQPAAGDPLGDNLAANDAVGLIAIEFATRRRMRLNGKAEVGKDGAITVRAQQVYSNCPKYIQARRWRGRAAAG